MELPGEKLLRSRSPQFVDPGVSKPKFEKEVDDFRAMGETYRRRGWFLIEAEFPQALVMLSAPQVRPWGIQYALLIDYTNYDLLPPSLEFVDPYTLRPLMLTEVFPLFQLQRAGPEAEPPQNAGVLAQDPTADRPTEPPPRRMQVTNLVQGHSGYPAFLCLPGTREYHAHPYHSNDPWLLHRGTGAGSLYNVVEVVWRHGILPAIGWQIQVQIGGPQLDAHRIP